LEEYSSSGETLASYTHGWNLISQNRDRNSLFYTYDGHSGVRQLSDRSGQITDTYNYDAYGNLLKTTGVSENNYLYRGEQFDPNIGLQYLRARYYDPELGRFPNVDPFEGRIEEPMSRHRYLYGNNNPVIYADPTGMVANIAELNVVTQMIGTLAAIPAAVPTVHLYGIGGTIIGSIGAAGVIANIRRRRGTPIKWEGTLTLNTLSSPGSPADLGLGGGWGVGLGAAKLSSDPVHGPSVNGGWIIFHAAFAGGFFITSTRDPVEVIQESKHDYPEPRALQGLFLYLGGGMTTSQEDNSLGVALFKMGQGKGKALPGLEGESVGIGFGAGGVIGYSYLASVR